MHSAFRPASLLTSPHAQTLWGPLVRRLPELPDRRAERMPLDDGDHLWLHHAGPAPQPGKARVVILHGLSGCEDSHYARGLQARLADRAIASVVVCARGTGGRPNDRARTYHSGETGDPARALDFLYRQCPESPLLVAGFSLGGSQLLNLLADREPAGVAAAVAVSVPLRLARCSDRLNRGISRLYRNHLIRQLVSGLEQKKEHLHRVAPEEAARLEALGDLSTIRTFRDFDNRVVAPLHGFRDADDYYSRCSAGPKLARIRTPTLLLHALDDPFMVPEVVPPRREISEAVQPEISRHGGHVGFVTGSPISPLYWLEERIPAFFSPWLDAEDPASLPASAR